MLKVVSKSLAHKALYGRRHGRGLRSGRRELVKSLLPSLEINLPGLASSSLTDCFEDYCQYVWLEIGFGGGEHLAWQAAVNPHIGMIGCEPFLNGVAKLLTRVRDEELKNVRLFCDDARLLIENLPENSIDQVFILFPDPWPKTRHHKRRIVSFEFLDHLARVLKNSAQVQISTDEPGYLEWILWHFRKHSAFSWSIRAPSECQYNPTRGPSTRYQEKAVANGRACVFLTYKRISRDKQHQS